jgi:hypothetical protein
MLFMGTVDVSPLQVDSPSSAQPDDSEDDHVYKSQGKWQTIFRDQSALKPHSPTCSPIRKWDKKYG